MLKLIRRKSIYRHKDSLKEQKAMSTTLHFLISEVAETAIPKVTAALAKTLAKNAAKRLTENEYQQAIFAELVAAGVTKGATKVTLTVVKTFGQNPPPPPVVNQTAVYVLTPTSNRVMIRTRNNNQWQNIPSVSELKPPVSLVNPELTLSRLKQRDRSN